MRKLANDRGPGKADLSSGHQAVVPCPPENIRTNLRGPGGYRVLGKFHGAPNQAVAGLVGSLPRRRGRAASVDRLDRVNRFVVLGLRDELISETFLELGHNSLAFPYRELDPLCCLPQNIFQEFSAGLSV